MEGIAWCAAAMNAAQARLEVAADNLANAHSDGFHRHVASFELTARGMSTRNSSIQTPGPLKETGRALDIAIAGAGALHVAPMSSALARGLHVESSRGGSFTRDTAGHLVDGQGRGLVGDHGLVRVADDRITITASGLVESNGRVVDRLAMAPGTRVASGFIETSNVDAIGEMMAILDAHRSFETAQKSLIALDMARQKAIDDAGMVK